MILRSPFRWIATSGLSCIALVMAVVAAVCIVYDDYWAASLFFLFAAFAVLMVVLGLRQHVVLEEGVVGLRTEWRTKRIPVADIRDVDVVKIHVGFVLPVSFPRLWLDEENVELLFMLRQITFGEENPKVIAQAKAVHDHVFAGRAVPDEADKPEG
ncbi:MULTISPECIES: EbsA family protein [Actinosynnema]|uniref:EbsA family protein n=1 Tax=Actinosynnema TaxID=40566 RepID=UPI0020A4D306|nr:EbsA family protein [Actinosynnema pretiosum]MCP2092203.1 hypothetical protein [Actinosynnema pretiosum]